MSNWKRNWNKGVSKTKVDTTPQLSCLKECQCIISHASFPAISRHNLTNKDKDTKSIMRNRYKQIIRENRGCKKKNPIQDYKQLDI